MLQSASQTKVIAVPEPHAGRPLDEVRFERAQLMSQLDGLRAEHREVRVELSHLREGSVEWQIRSERVGELNERIALLERQLDVNATEINEAAPPTESVAVPPPLPYDLPRLPPEYRLIAILFMLFTFLPISLAFARRIWRRGSSAVASVPAELLERMNRMEHIAEATALEVERIGEGQRFMTALMNESLAAAKQLPAQRSQRGRSAGERGAQRDAVSGDSPLPGMITPV